MIPIWIIIPALLIGGIFGFLIALLTYVGSNDDDNDYRY